MADLLRVYNRSTLIAEQESPVNLINLTPETKYNLKCAWFNGVKESELVDVPEFTTAATPETPVVPTAMTVEKKRNAIKSR